MGVFRIHLDVCCLNRPFDDQSQTRIRLEAEAVLLIIAQCGTQRWQWVASEAIAQEISRTPDPERRRRVQTLVLSAHVQVRVEQPIVARASRLSSLGFSGFDALHIACAESANASVLLTADDALVRKSKSHEGELKVQVMNPLAWLRKVRAA